MGPRPPAPTGEGPGAVRRRTPSAPSALAIPDDLADHVVTGTSGHAAAGVSSAGALVQAPDRSAVIRVAWRGPHMEQLIRRQLSVKDVAPDQVPLMLHLPRADHLSREHRVLQARHEVLVDIE